MCRALEQTQRLEVVRAHYPHHHRCQWSNTASDARYVIALTGCNIAACSKVCPQSNGLCHIYGKSHHKLLHRTTLRDGSRLITSHRRSRRPPRNASARPLEPPCHWALQCRSHAATTSVSASLTFEHQHTSHINDAQYSPHTTTPPPRITQHVCISPLNNINKTISKLQR